MSLVIFIIIFIVINILLLKWTEVIWSDNSNNITKESCYNISYVRTSVRIIIGNFESNEMLEEKRFALSKSLKF